MWLWVSASGDYETTRWTANQTEDKSWSYRSVSQNWTWWNAEFHSLAYAFISFFLPKWHLWLWNCILLHIFILIWLKVHLFMFTLHCTGCQCFYACVHGLWKYWSLYRPVWGLHSGSKTYKLVDSCPPHTPLSPGDTDALIPWKNRLLFDAFLWFVRSKALFYRE